MKYLKLFVLINLLPLLFCCNKNSSGGTVSESLVFDSIPVTKILTPLIRETSGIADSKRNTGYLWLHEDGGSPPELTLINHNGTTQKKIVIKNATNRDWEDMALSGNELYIADIGDNNQAYPFYTFYIFPEPALATDTVTNASSIRFYYPDGSHDAEAFLVDPVTKDIYIITKRDIPARIYKLSFPYAPSSTVTLVGNLPYFFVTSAAISADGKEILVRDYSTIYYYNKSAGQPIDQALRGTYRKLPHVVEPQGEAVSFANDNTGFFSLSELGNAATVNLYFYKRK